MKHKQRKKNLGQCFLHNKQILAKIIQQVGTLSPEIIIIEIGVGAGVLTRALAQAYPNNNIIGFEIDQDLQAEVADLTAQPRVKILWQDFLTYYSQTDFYQEIGVKSGQEIVVVANIPYGISREILVALMRYEVKFAVLLVQQEFAEKLLTFGNEGRLIRPKELVALSVMVNIYFEIKGLFKVGRGCFRPNPHVDSQVLSLCWKGQKYQSDFEQLVGQFFQQRRKMMGKTWAFLSELGIDERVRVEGLELKDWQKIAIFLH